MASVVALAACSSGASGGAGGTETLTIGVIAPLTGPGAAFGNGIQGAVQLAVDDVNKAGGIKAGDTTYTIKIKSYDDKYQAPDGLKALNQLVQLDKLNIYVGSYGGLVNKALAPVATQDKVLNLTDGVGDYIGPDHPYMFRVHPDPSLWGPAVGQWLTKNAGGPGGVKTVALLTTNDESGAAAAKPIKAGLEQGGAAVTSSFYETGASDYSSVLTRVIQSKPDLLELVARPTDGALLLKQARELGYEGPITQFGGPIQETVLSVAGPEYSEGFTYAQPFDTRKDALKDFAKRYKDTYNAQMNDLSPAFYDSMFLLFNAMSQAGTVTDTDKIAAALREVTYDSPFRGTISFGGEEHWGCKCEIESPYYIGQIKGGQFTVAAQVPDF